MDFYEQNRTNMVEVMILQCFECFLVICYPSDSNGPMNHSSMLHVNISQLSMAAPQDFLQTLWTEFRFHH